MLTGRIAAEVDLAGGRPYQRLGGFMVPPGVVITLTGDDGNPGALIRYECRDGSVRCVEFTVTAQPDGRGIRPGDLQTIDLDGIAQTEFREWGYSLPLPGQRATPVEFPPAADAPDTAGMRAEIAHAQRPAMAELSAVADVYNSARSAPVATVQNALGYKSRRTASRRVKQAREAGLIDG